MLTDVRGTCTLSCDCCAGFKEMYCDVDPDGELAKPDKEGPPRQQVFTALAGILSDDKYKVSCALPPACPMSLSFAQMHEQGSRAQASSITHTLHAC